MSEAFIFRDVKAASAEILPEGIFIMLINACDRPPHLALLTGSKIYALSAKGRQVMFPLEKQLRLIKSRKIKSLFIKLSNNIYISDNQLFKKAENSVLLYEKAAPGIATCLSPVKLFCASVFGVDVSGVNFIFDLLPLLQKDNLVSGYYHFWMEDVLIGGNFHFQKYTMQDIYESIRRMEPHEIIA